MRKRILVADDEYPLRVMIETTLRKVDADVVLASNGAEALALAQEQPPDLIVLDWMMPGLTGIEVASAIREKENMRHIPIIMLTARSQARDQEAARIVGTDHYLTKPFSPRQFIELVEKSLLAAAK